MIIPPWVRENKTYVQENMYSKRRPGMMKKGIRI